MTTDTDSTITQANLYRHGAVWSYRADTVEGYDHTGVLDDADTEADARDELARMFPGAVVHRVADVPTAYAYTIYDRDPSRGPALTLAEDVAVEADTEDEAVDELRDAIEVAAAGLSPEDGYAVGDTIVGHLECDGVIVRTVTYALTSEDLGVEPITCACSHCAATTETPTAWRTSDDGERYCDDCIDYTLDDDEYVVCQTHGRD